MGDALSRRGRLGRTWTNSIKICVQPGAVLIDVVVVVVPKPDMCTFRFRLTHTYVPHPNWPAWHGHGIASHHTSHQGISRRRWKEGFLAIVAASWTASRASAAIKPHRVQSRGRKGAFMGSNGSSPSPWISIPNSIGARSSLVCPPSSSPVSQPLDPRRQAT